MYKRVHRKWFFMLALGLMTSLNGAVYAQQGEGSEASPAMTFKKVPIKLPRIGTLFSVDKSDEGISNPVVQPLFKNYLNGLTVGGFYRGFFLNRNMSHGYPGTPDDVIRVGDGQIDPVLMLYFSGNMTPNTSFGADISAASPFFVYQGPGYGRDGNSQPYITAVLRGSFKTKLGTFNMKAGGIEFLTITPFTFGANVNFNRYSVFERRPWDPGAEGNVKTRYASYYYSGTINQDARFGTQAFKGYILNGFIPAINTNVDFFYGKTQQNGGYFRINQTRPSSNMGARVKKNFKNGNYISLNTFNSYQHSDSVNHNKADVQWNIYTSEYFLNFKGFTLSGEFGAGRYMSPTVKENWSEAFTADLTIPKKVVGIPIALRYYQIGQYFTSNVANFNNTTIAQVTQGNTSVLGINPFGGSLENVGDMNNNRRGAAINLTSIKVWKFTFATGTQISEELQKLDVDTLLYYSHRVNSLVWSRLPNYFPVNVPPGQGIGPDGRISVYYRGVSEKVRILDRNADGTPTSKRYFNSWDIQAKFKNKIFNRDFYMFYLGTFSSAQSSLSATPKFDDDAYIRTQFHELDVYYNITSDIVLALYGGLEYVKGNQYTDISTVTGKPRNQVGTAIGYGFDYSFSRSTTLYFRHRWFTFEDKGFPAEKFSGNEATVELKMFF
ncbi:MAG: hypothetical protein JWM14_1904 [Chitinophagaceae bacterium]|nr:hypothetical protein [Chitinophagaceae bacterium]